MSMVSALRTRGLKAKKEQATIHNDSLIHFSVFPDYFTWNFIQLLQTFPNKKPLQTAQLLVIWEKEIQLGNGKWG